MTSRSDDLRTQTKPAPKRLIASRHSALHLPGAALTINERQLVTPRLSVLPLALTLLLVPAVAQTSTPVAGRMFDSLLPLASQPQSSQTAAPATTLHGVVLNAITHQPIARALVTLDQYGLAMLTDNEGRFTFDGIPVGQASVSARRPGYTADDGGNNNTARQTVAVPGTGDVTLELIPQSSITGQLILPGDDSPDSLQLQLLHQEIQNGVANWTIYRGTEANSDGRFRFGNLPSGAYLVHIAASLDPAPALQPAGSGKPRSGYVPAFYPGVRAIDGAGVITLATGQQAEIKMELTREPFYPVAIPVANYEDARGVNFEVASDSFLGLAARFSPEDGMVHMELPNGHYLLEARGNGQRAMSGQREFDVSGGQTRAGAITLSPANRIPVIVHAEFTHTQTQAAPAGGGVLSAANQVSLNLQRQGNGPATHGQRASLQDDPGSSTSGISQLVGVSPGRYWVNANAFNGYIAAMTSGGVDLLQSPLTVSPGGSASPIEITLRDDTASVSALLSSTLQPSSAGTHPALYLQVVPLGGPGTSRSQAFAADGTANLANLPPGSYLVFASTSHRPIAYRNPSVMAVFAGKGQTVNVEPGGSARITIDSVVDAPGIPPAETSGGGL